MLAKALAAVAGLIVLTAAIVVAVFAAAYALYAVLEGPLAPAGAAAIVALVFAVLVALTVLLVSARAGGHKHEEEVEELSLTQRLFGLARERPLLSAGAAVAAALIAIRNPALVATIVAAFMKAPKSGR